MNKIVEIDGFPLPDTTDIAIPKNPEEDEDTSITLVNTRFNTRLAAEKVSSWDGDVNDLTETGQIVLERTLKLFHPCLKFIENVEFTERLYETLETRCDDLHTDDERDLTMFLSLPVNQNRLTYSTEIFSNKLIWPQGVVQANKPIPSHPVRPGVWALIDGSYPHRGNPDGPRIIYIVSITLKESTSDKSLLNFASRLSRNVDERELRYTSVDLDKLPPWQPELSLYDYKPQFWDQGPKLRR